MRASLPSLLDRIPAQLSVPPKWHPYRPPSYRPAGMPGHRAAARAPARSQRCRQPGLRPPLACGRPLSSLLDRNRPANQHCQAVSLPPLQLQASEHAGRS
ncbi:MAG: hypothetical protein NTU95_10775 [Methanothrix sp.]|nr:hypothetical protein [Methanothrix sp.]